MDLTCPTSSPGINYPPCNICLIRRHSGDLSFRSIKSMIDGRKIKLHKNRPTLLKAFVIPYFCNNFLRNILADGPVKLNSTHVANLCWNNGF